MACSARMRLQLAPAGVGCYAFGSPPVLARADKDDGRDVLQVLSTVHSTAGHTHHPRPHLPCLQLPRTGCAGCIAIEMESDVSGSQVIMPAVHTRCICLWKRKCVML